MIQLLGKIASGFTGLLLSRAALQRFGGRLDLKDAPAGGVEAQIELPLDGLLADAR